jgi:hypothetical protein
MISEFPLPASNAQTADITVGPDNALWFTEVIPNAQSGKIVGKIGRITPDGQISEFPLPSNSFAASITTGRDGNLWFIEPGRSGASPRLARSASSLCPLQEATFSASRRARTASSGLPNLRAPKVRAGRSDASLLRVRSASSHCHPTPSLVISQSDPTVTPGSPALRSGASLL